SAFSQDVVKTRYANFAEVMDYCRRSANPVGRLMLHLYRATLPRHLAWSDEICSSLQLINFWQDVDIDFRKNRIYLPADEMAEYAVNETQIAQRNAGGRWRELMLFQTGRTRRMLLSGAPLGRTLPGRIGLELRMIVMGGNRILDKLEACGGDVFRHRPVLRTLDWIVMLHRALFAYR
ncbi:MAG: squalene/phytoene synthase family protein, partial [Betaproteobacteria bacterium]